MMNNRLFRILLGALIGNCESWPQVAYEKLFGSLQLTFGASTPNTPAQDSAMKRPSLQRGLLAGRAVGYVPARRFRGGRLTVCPARYPSFRRPVEFSNDAIAEAP